MWPLVNQQTWVMARVASGPRDLLDTIVFLFFFFLIYFLFLPPPTPVLALFLSFFSSFFSHFLPSLLPLSYCKPDSVFEVIRAEEKKKKKKTLSG